MPCAVMRVVVGASPFACARASHQALLCTAMCDPWFPSIHAMAAVLLWDQGPFSASLGNLRPLLKTVPLLTKNGRLTCI